VRHLHGLIAECLVHSSTFESAVEYVNKHLLPKPGESGMEHASAMLVLANFYAIKKDHEHAIQIIEDVIESLGEATFGRQGYVA
jgi:hypothetical protein